jgi:hypothetical protein
VKNNLTDLIVYSFLVGGILVLTRPGSQGPQFIKSLTGGYTNIVQASTGQKVSTSTA